MFGVGNMLSRQAVDGDFSVCVQIGFYAVARKIVGTEKDINGGKVNFVFLIQC